MIEKRINKKYLKLFLKNLRYQDRKELENSNINNFLEFYKICTSPLSEIYFLVNKNDFPMALGGVYDVSKFGLKIGQIWLLSTPEIYKNKLAFLKYIKNKIDFFKNNYDVLFNYIYEPNFSFLKFLKANEFKILNTNKFDYKLFYFCKGDINFDLRYFAC